MPLERYLCAPTPNARSYSPDIHALIKVHQFVLTLVYWIP